jgi:hypothetical protein
MKHKLLTLLLNTPGLETFVIAVILLNKLKRYKKRKPILRRRSTGTSARRITQYQTNVVLKKKQLDGKPVKCLEGSCKAHSYKLLVARKIQHKFVGTPSVGRTVSILRRAQLPCRDNIEC